jgi:hypothetical protein
MVSAVVYIVSSGDDRFVKVESRPHVVDLNLKPLG